THHELLTRVRSLLRIKRYHDEIKELNLTLEERVRTQVEELERLRRLRRFLSPHIADAIVTSGDESILSSHRRQVAMFFAALRGWTKLRRRGRAGGADARARRVPRDDRRPREAVRGNGRLPRGRRRPALLQRPDRGSGRSPARGAAGLRAPRGDGRAHDAMAEARERPRLRRRPCHVLRNPRRR